MPVALDALGIVGLHHMNVFEFVSYDQIPLSAILALDMSSSLAGERLNDLRRAAAVLVAA